MTVEVESYCRTSGQMCTESQCLCHQTEPTNAEVLAEVRALKEEIQEIKKTVTDLIDELQPYIVQITPMIQAIESSPMVRALTGIKRSSGR